MAVAISSALTNMEVNVKAVTRKITVMAARVVVIPTVTTRDSSTKITTMPVGAAAISALAVATMVTKTITSKTCNRH